MKDLVKSLLEIQVYYISQIIPIQRLVDTFKKFQ